MTDDPAQRANDEGNEHFNAGRMKSAAKAFRRATDLAPGVARYWANLCEARRRIGRIAKAVEAGRKAVALDEAYAPGHADLGIALTDQGAIDEAIAELRLALQLDASSPFSWNALGNALKNWGDPSGAEGAYRRSLELKPDYAGAHSNLALMLRDRGEVALARDHFNLALRHDPKNHNARSSLGMLDLLEGDFAQGWVNYEARWQSNEMKARSFSMPAWDGKASLQGRRLYLHAEQGFGDAIQFCRYIPRLQMLGATLVFEVREPLVCLLRDSFPGVEVVPAGGAPVFGDFHAGLLSLPRLFETRLSDIPGKVPYLTPPASATALWQKELSATKGLKVGFVWAGSGGHLRDRSRSLTIDAFFPLAELPGITWFSLQVGPRAPELAKWPGQAPRDLSPRLTDFAQTAAAISALDLVITVDTSVAHLAGALAKPAFVLLSFIPDWRWLLGRSDSPWYPTLRLLRQSQVDDWSSPLTELRQALATAAR